MIEKQDMIMAKYGHSLCSLQNQIYCIGGNNGSKAVANCEVFSITSNTWNALPNLATPRKTCAAVLYRKQWIYAIAGFNDKNCINSIERLGILSN